MIKIKCTKIEKNIYNKELKRKKSRSLNYYLETIPREMSQQQAGDGRGTGLPSIWSRQLQVIWE